MHYTYRIYNTIYKNIKIFIIYIPFSCIFVSLATTSASFITSLSLFTVDLLTTFSVNYLLIGFVLNIKKWKM